MNVLVIASQPDIPGAGTRHALLERGARLERERIIAILNGDNRFMGARRLLLEQIQADD
jgi:hypothetical protein